MLKEPPMQARLRNVIAALGAARLVVVLSSSAGAVSPAPVSGGPSWSRHVRSPGAGGANERHEGCAPQLRRLRDRASPDHARQPELRGDRVARLSAYDRAPLTAEIGADSSATLPRPITNPAVKSARPTSIAVDDVDEGHRLRTEAASLRALRAIAQAPALATSRPHRARSLAEVALCARSHEIALNGCALSWLPEAAS